MKAWAVKIKGYPEFSHVAWGPTAGKVRYEEVLSSKDAGYAFSFSDIQVKRYPICDTNPEQDAASDYRKRHQVGIKE